MRLRGFEMLTPEQLTDELTAGARFVYFEYCISLLLVTWRRPTDIYLIRPGQNWLAKAIPWTLLTLLLGWWGLPWGLLCTPAVLVVNLSGGRDVTPEVTAFLRSQFLPAPDVPA